MASGGKNKNRKNGAAAHRPSPLLRTLKISAIAVFLAGFALVFAEVFMFLAEPLLFGETYRYDKDLGFRLMPSEKKNQFGFNDHDYPLEKEPGTYRIVIVADSFNWAGGRDGNYTALLEKKFEEHYGSHRVDVINAGYPGADPADHLALMKKFGMQYKPDLVVLGFFCGNDFLDAFPNSRRISFNGMLTTIDRDKDFEYPLMGRAIIRRSRFIDLIKKRSKILSERKKAGEEKITGGGDDPKYRLGNLSRESKLKIETRRLFITSPELHERGAFRTRVYHILDAITRLNDLAAASGAEFAVAFYPDQFQVDRALLDEIIAYNRLDRNSILLYLPQGIAIKHLESLSVPYIDLTSGFAKAEEREQLYNEQDTHWNERGNELAAQLLFDWLVPKTNLELSY